MTVSVIFMSGVSVGLWAGIFSEFQELEYGGLDAVLLHGHALCGGGEALDAGGFLIRTPEGGGVVGEVQGHGQFFTAKG